MRKFILTFLAVVYCSITFASSGCPNGGQECCSNAFWTAHDALMASGWSYGDAYDYLLPSFQVCLYGFPNENN